METKNLLPLIKLRDERLLFRVTTLYCKNNMLLPLNSSLTGRPAITYYHFSLELSDEFITCFLLPRTMRQLSEKFHLTTISHHCFSNIILREFYHTYPLKSTPFSLLLCFYMKFFYIYFYRFKNPHYLNEYF